MNDTARVLVVDDNPAIHEDFAKIFHPADPSSQELDQTAAELFEGPPAPLSSLTYHLDSAFQGHQALGLTKQALQDQRPYALAFVDIRMPPGWDGIETIHQLWQVSPEMQIVICTAYSDYSWQQILSQTGARDNLVILKKPFDTIEVQQLANTLVRKWFLAQQVQQRLENLDHLVYQRTLELSEINQNLHKEIEERELIEKALRLSEQRFSKAFASNPIPMAILNLPEARIIDANENFVRLLAQQRGGVIGHTCEEMVTSAELQSALQDLVATHRPVRQLQTAFQLPAGPRRDVIVSMDLLDVSDQAHLLLIAQDVTDQRALEHQLRQAQKVEAIGQLAAGVAHDFNNILTVIQGHIGLCTLATQPPPQISDSLKQIGAAADRAASLTRQLLTFSHKQTLQRRVINLNEVLLNLRKMLGRLIGENVLLEWELAPDLPNVVADVGCMEQVMMNLVVNARDALPQGGKIWIGTQKATFTAEVPRQFNCEAREGDYVVLSVRDTGCGMAAEVVAHIFEPFFTTKELGKGTGLGLATVQSIIKQHTGWIVVHSTPGQGTEFRIHLPATTQPTRDQPLPAPSNQAPRGREHILLVEDEVPLREMTVRILSQHGYTVYAAPTVKKALEIWRHQQGRLDLLLTDVVLPDTLTGVKLAEILRAERPSLPIIYMSGYSLDFAGKDLSRERDFHFLQKPFTSLHLLQTLRQGLDQNQLLAAAH